MKALFGVLVFAMVALAQTPTLTLTRTDGQGVIRVPATVSVELTAAGMQATGCAATQWSIVGAPGTMTCTPGTALAGKGLYSAVPVPGGQTNFIVAGGLNVMVDGVLASCQVTVPASSNGTFNLAVAGALSTDPQGSRAIATTAGPSLGFTGASACDQDANGRVELLDLTLAEAQVIGLAACTTADLNGEGKCTIQDLQREIVAIATGSCVTGP